MHARKKKQPLWGLISPDIALKLQIYVTIEALKSECSHQLAGSIAKAELVFYFIVQPCGTFSHQSYQIRWDILR